MRLDTITTQTALRLMNEVVKERGLGHVQRECVNVSIYHGEDGNRIYKPECLVGSALVKHGVTGEDFWNGGVCHASIDSTAGSLKALGVVDITEEAEKVFRMAQLLQDTGTPWGTALKTAELTSAVFL